MHYRLQGRSQDFISTEARGKPGIWGRSPQPVGIWGPGAEPLVRGSGANPPEAESFSVVECPKKIENLLQLSYFTTFIIQQKCLKLRIYNGEVLVASIKLILLQ